MNSKSVFAILTVAACGGMLWTGGASSAVAAQSAASADKKGEGGSSRRLCRSIQPTGSRFPERICRTKQEWDESTERARRNHEERQREGRNVPEIVPQ